MSQVDALEGFDKLSSDRALPNQLLVFRTNQTYGERFSNNRNCLEFLNGLYSLGEEKHALLMES